MSRRCIDRADSLSRCVPFFSSESVSAVVVHAAVRTVRSCAARLSGHEMVVGNVQDSMSMELHARSSVRDRLERHYVRMAR